MKLIKSLYQLSLTLALLFSISTAGAQDVVNIYVSPTGNDNSNGNSAGSAFKTIEKAQQSVRAILKSTGAGKPIVVHLAAGDYSISKPLRFSYDDSGLEQAPVIYQGSASGEVIINGGKQICGWQAYKDGLWRTRVAGVKEGRWTFRQLFVNGELRTRARTPNQGFFRVKGFPDGADHPYNTPSQRFEFAEGDINHKWRNLKDIEVIVYHFWTDTHLPIASVDGKSRIVSFQHKSGKMFTDDFTKDGARYVVENVWEGLDTAGEWYLDKKSGYLYYKPMPGENMSELQVVAPVAPEFLRIEGKPLEQKHVSNLQFRNPKFLYTNWDLPPGNANNRQGSASVPAAITLSGAKNVVFDNCIVGNIGTFAFDIIDGSRNNRIVNCRLENLGGGGIRVNGGTHADAPLLRTGNNEISDNIIDNYGQVYPSAVGVLLMNADKNRVIHNEISNGSYTGISVGWVWGYTRSLSNHNLIESNYIHHIGTKGLLSDMGGIYTLGISPGTVIRNNIIHDVNANHYGGGGIYNDEGSSYILVENNLVYNTKFAPYNIHFAKEITVRNNIFVLGKLEQLSRGKMESHKSVYFENNIVYWKDGDLLTQNWKDKQYTFYTIPGDSIQENSTFDFDYNLFYNPSRSIDTTKFNGDNFKDWQKRGKDKNSIYMDPLFVDVSRYDFRLQPNSPAFKLGFNPIDFSNVGPRGKQSGNKTTSTAQ